MSNWIKSPTILPGEKSNSPPVGQEELSNPHAPSLEAKLIVSFMVEDDSESSV